MTCDDIYARPASSPAKKAKKSKKGGKSASKSALKQSPSVPIYFVDTRSRSPGPRYVKVPLVESNVRSPSRSPITVGPSERAKKVSQYTEPKSTKRPHSPELRKYRNEALEHKTNLIQQEYDNLLNEMLQSRQQQAVRGDDDGFYWVMNDYIREYCGSRTGLAPP